MVAHGSKDTHPLNDEEPQYSVIYPELVKILYQRSGIALATTLAGVLIIAWFFRGVISPEILFPWVILQVVLLFFRAVQRSVILTKIAKGKYDPFRYELYFIISVFLTGVLWGSIVYFPLIDKDQVHYFSLMVFVIGGFLAGASVSLSPSFISFLSFFVPAMVPMVTRVALLDDQISGMMTLFLALFGVALTEIARQNNLLIRSSLIEKYKNRVLFESLKKTNSQLDLERKKAVDALSSKSIFFASMSHELRTPLNSIIGFARIILETGVKGEIRKYMNIIEKSGSHLLTIIRDILDFSAIETGKFTLYPTHFKLEKVLYHIGELFEPLAYEKSLDFDPGCATANSTFVFLDENRLQQVLTNLVANAIKYTREGYVQIRHQIRTTSDGDPELYIEVIDSGVGIPEEKRGELFQEFVRLGTDGSYKQTGSGLGLLIARRVIENMGGEIGVGSNGSKGSVFWFRVPLAPGEYSVQTVEVEPGPLSSKNAVILLPYTVSSEVLKDLLVPEFQSVKIMPIYDVDWQEVDTFLDRSGYLFIHGYAIPELRRNAPALFEKAESGEVSLVSILSIAEKIEFPEKLEGVRLVTLDKPFMRDSLAQIFCQEAGYEESESIHQLIGEEEQHPVCQESEVKHNKTILVVDDNEVNRALMEIIIERLGFSTVMAKDGAEALSMYKSGKFMMIFMDCVMPVMDGFEATEKIRELEKESREFTPIIALSANDTKEDKELCFRYGMDGHMGKPIDQEKIAEVIDYFFDNGKVKQ